MFVHVSLVYAVLVHVVSVHVPPVCVVLERFVLMNTLQSVINVLVLLLDICVALISVLTDIVWKITLHWYAGDVVCRVVRYLQVCVVYVVRHL